MPDKPASLYSRLGGYDAIAAVVDDLLPRLRADEILSRF
jgi:hemoglobin